MVDDGGNPVGFVKLKLKGKKTKITRVTSSDGNGFFEFADLDADSYLIIAKKNGYKHGKQVATLAKGEEKEIKVEMKK